KPNAGPKKEIGNALGKRGRHSTPRSPARLNNRNLLSERGLSRGQASNRNPERATADVIQAESMTEFHAVGFAAVFTANTDLDHRSNQIIKLSFLFRGHFCRYAIHDIDLKLQFSRESDQRNHDFRSHSDSF